MFNAENRICVNNREMNGYDDSDFFSTFLIDGTDQFEEIMIGSTRFGGGSYFTPINASDEVKALYSAWLGAQAAKRELSAIRVGKKCIILKSRKNKDKVGTIGWIGRSRFDSRVTNALVVFPDYSDQEVIISRIKLVY